MAKARTDWLFERASWDSSKLVFLDETGVATNMTRRYGRAPKGSRCVAGAPHGHWHSNSFVAALKEGAVIAPLLLDGPMNGEAFLTYVSEILGPALRPGDLVIADNLSSHKVAGVKDAIERAGATILFLPPYSPDLNPIEMLFAKIKALLRKTAKRSIQEVTSTLGSILDKGYRGRKSVCGTEVVIPGKISKKLSYYQQRKKRKRNARRAAIEPVIGHLKSDYRMARCFLKGALGAGLNLALAAAAWNLKKWINELLWTCVLWLRRRFNSPELYHQSDVDSSLRAA